MDKPSLPYLCSVVRPPYPVPQNFCDLGSTTQKLPLKFKTFKTSTCCIVLQWIFFSICAHPHYIEALGISVAGSVLCDLRGRACEAETALAASIWSHDVPSDSNQVFENSFWKYIYIISVNISDNIQSIIYSLHINVAQHLFQPYLHAILHQVLASGDSATSSVVHFASGKRMPWSPGLLWIDGASQTGSGWVSMHLIPNIVSILECWKYFSWFSQNYRTLSAPR